jgi:YidC/Oxa1 family membrane protein insertase
MSFLWNEVLYRPIFNALILVYNLLPYKDVGLAIIVLTVVIRLILLPLSWPSMKSQRLLQSLQPELEKIKEQYKNDQQTLSTKTMEFYKKHGINPLASCLPLLIQLPILIALYQVLRGGLTGEHYDLLYSFVSRPENFNVIFLGLIDLTKAYWPLAIVVGLVQLAQGLLMRPVSKPKAKPTAQLDAKKTADKEDQPLFNAEDLSAAMGTQFTYIMPLMTVFIAWNLFSGLPLYWITTTFFSVVVQLVVNWRYPVKQIQTADKEYHEKPVVQFDPDDYIIEKSQEKNVSIAVKRRQGSK